MIEVRTLKAILFFAVLPLLMLSLGSGACSAARPARPLLMERDLSKCATAPGEYSISNRGIRADLLEKLLCSAKRLELQDVDILGDRWFMLREVGAELSALRVHFEGDLTFEGVRFLKRVDLRDCTFLGDTSFAGCVFAEAAFFWYDPLPEEGDKAPSVFRGRAEFEDTVFEGPVSFRGTAFGRCDFKGLRCAAQADFSSVKLLRNADFAGARFGGVAYFDHVILSGDYLRFWDAVFEQTASFEGMTDEGGHCLVYFAGARFKAWAYFNGARLSFLDLETRVHEPRDPMPLTDWPLPPGPTVFYGPVCFDGLVCGRADFTEAEFHDCASFLDSWFVQGALFDRVRFSGAVDFTGTVFPTVKSASMTVTLCGLTFNAPGGLSLESTHFGGPVLMSCGQLFNPRPLSCAWRDPRPKLLVATAETWKALEDIFAKADDLPGRCEASYQRRLSGGAPSGRATALLDVLSRRFWGYGFRPWRLIRWISVVFLIFTYAYWTQTKPMARQKAGRGGRWRRMRYALLFSLNTSCPWKPGYGYQRSLTPAFRTITSVQYVVFLVLLLCFTYVLSNTNPVMKMLASKLLGL